MCHICAISPFVTMFSTLYGTYFSFQMHFKMSSATCFNLDQSKILSSGNGVNSLDEAMLRSTHYKRFDIQSLVLFYFEATLPPLTWSSGSVFTNHYQECSLSFSPRFVNLNVTQLLIGMV